MQTHTSSVNKPLDNQSVEKLGLVLTKKTSLLYQFHDEGAVFLWSISCLLTKRQKEGSNKKACQSYANRPLAGIRTGYIVSK